MGIESKRPDGRSVKPQPSAMQLFRDCAVTVGRHGKQVSIQCDTAEEADRVYEWLESLAKPS